MNDEAQTSNHEQSPKLQMTNALDTPFRHSDFVIVWPFEIRILSF